MKDERKFRLFAILTALLSVLIVAYNISSEYFLPDIEGYIKRRVYYEKVISKKGLSLHKAMYWRGYEPRREGYEPKREGFKPLKNEPAKEPSKE
ncbi:MAG: hypothetical protein Q8J64_03085 [Thermodesulfovibrionales bacterium]|nr:hypothetical protein [Thermodesulfovibrionales bacterium]